MKVKRTFLTVAAFILCIAALNTSKAQADILVSMKSNAETITIYVKWTPSTTIIKANGVVLTNDINTSNPIPVNEDSMVFITTEENAQLTMIHCSNNQLTELDVTNNTALRELYCYENQLTELDVTNNTVLRSLECSNNKLAKLDITNNTALIGLGCSNNFLTELDITNNTALGDMYCSNNQLTELDVTNNTALKELHAHGQQIEVPILIGATTFPNPIFYKTPTGEESVRIESAWYAYQDEVPITGNTMKFTTNLPAGIVFGDAFGGIIIFISDVMVSFESNGGSEIASRMVRTNSKLTNPTDPTKDGYVFDAWYKESSLTTAWNFQTDVVTEDITLYAKWIENGSNIAETQANTINIYPNPAQHTLYIQSEEVVEQVNVYDISGRNLLQIANPDKSVDISSFAKGVYIMKIKTSTRENVKKIVKN